MADTGVIHGEREVPKSGGLGEGQAEQPPLFLPHHIKLKERLSWRPVLSWEDLTVRNCEKLQFSFSFNS